MKIITPEEIDQIRGRRLTPDDPFCFRCHATLSCFNQCCRNLNLLLYPYDVLRLKNRLEVSSDRFIEEYVDVVLREGTFFPEVLLKMAANDEHTCPFLSPEGCSVYSDRPDTCRTFPVEQGTLFDGPHGETTPIFIYRPPDFCLGQHENKTWTTATWSKDQEAEGYHRMTRRWSDIRRMLASNPWGREGAQGARAKMTFMAAYNIDRFREFIFKSSFLKRYRIQSAVKKKIRRDDTALLSLGFDWIKLFLWQIPSKKIRLKR